MREFTISTWIRPAAILVLLVAVAGAAYAAGPSVSLLGGGQVADSGPGPRVAFFAVDVFFDYPLVVCQPNNPNCNAKTVHVCVDFHTASGTATSGVDFVPKQGSFDKTVTFTEAGDIPIGTIAVDVIADDLTEGTETFKVVLSNPAVCHSDAGLGDSQAEATIFDAANPPILPDLAISAITLLRDCKMELTLRNEGPGPLSDQAYDPKQGVAIQMSRDGQAWGGIRLAGVDPAKKLKVPGGSIKAIWFPNAANLKLTNGPQDITVMIDRLNSVAEVTELNNVLNKRLLCRR